MGAPRNIKVSRQGNAWVVSWDPPLHPPKGKIVYVYSILSLSSKLSFGIRKITETNTVSIQGYPHLSDLDVSVRAYIPGVAKSIYMAHKKFDLSDKSVVGV